jgi:hypothetical protein
LILFFPLEKLLDPATAEDRLRTPAINCPHRPQYGAKWAHFLKAVPIISYTYRNPPWQYPSGVNHLTWPDPGSQARGIRAHDAPASLQVSKKIIEASCNQGSFSNCRNPRAMRAVILERLCRSRMGLTKDYSFAIFRLKLLPQCRKKVDSIEQPS